MVKPNSDQLALIAQADLDRLVKCALRPVLQNLEPQVVPIAKSDGAGPDYMDAFLNAAQAATHNDLCKEVRKAFALTIGAIFERHVRVWLAKADAERTNEVENARGFAELLRLIKEIKQVDVAALPFVSDLEQLWEVVSALRHGEGRATEKLAAIAPELFQEAVFPADHRFTRLTVRDADLERYYRATMMFWGSVGATPP